MSDERDPKVVSRATDMGWRDKPDFKGDPELWVDADEYVRRGEVVLPLVKAENRRLQQKQDELSGEISRLTKVVLEQRQSMDELVEHSADQLRERLVEQKRQITAELRAARKEEDDTAIEALEERLEENAEAREKLKEKPVAKSPVQQTPQTPVETPEYKAWVAANGWFGGSSRLDQAKTAAAQRFGVEMAAAGKRGQAFFDAVDEAMAEVYPPAAPRKDPTEDGRPSGGSGSSSSSASGFNALPAEAKAKAKEQAPKFVGKNKMFKDEKAWFDYYAKQYNMEAA